MKVNLVIVFNKNKDKVLMCQRRKDPYKGKLNFVGGKVQKGESSENAAYRELFEETGISSKDIVLHHLVDSIYFIQDLTLEVYFGYLEKALDVYGDEKSFIVDWCRKQLFLKLINLPVKEIWGILWK